MVTLEQAQALKVTLNNYPNSTPTSDQYDQLSEILTWNSTPESPSALSGSWIWTTVVNLDYLSILQKYIATLGGE